MIIAFAAVSVFGAIMSIVYAMFGGAKRGTSMESRIQDFRTRAVSMEEDEVNLELPFGERVLRPTIEGFSRTISSVLPASVLSDIQKQLMMAGHPMTLQTYLTFWGVLFSTFTGLGLVFFVVLPGSLLIQKLLFVVMFAALGFVFPRIWLKGKVKARQKLVIRAMPDAMDLITTCVEAGLGLDAALARVVSRMLRDVAMGKMRREAMTELEQRIGVEELTTFITSIIQAEQLGVGIAQVLRVQSDQLRTKRRQRAEKSAHEAPIKMLFPLVLFIFPAFLLVILGPAAIRIAQSLS
ncbi:MAG: type II secretion system F family protein [Chloroflexi bacterium]|nr:MAG: type II secretion system F family protein [Chloroflexota bacterium]